jgi:hypothetical protein
MWTTKDVKFILRMRMGLIHCVAEVSAVESRADSVEPQHYRIWNSPW